MTAIQLPRTNKYIPYHPFDKQAAFLWLNCHEAFYGGAAGGGKSLALLMGALQYVDVPRYNALLLRRTYKDLSKPRALMDVAFEWLGPTDARWNAMNFRWTFPSGATLSFGHLDSENEKFDYQSAEYHYIGFDELTQFAESQYTYLASRIRRLKGMDIPMRLRSASNPGGTGHEWVKAYFVDVPPNPDRRFIPARAKDNPALDLEEYEQMLALLDPVTRLQLREGNWDVRPEGNKFKHHWLPTVELRGKDKRGMRFVRYWDLAATEPAPGNDPDYTAGVLLGTDNDGIYYVFNVMRDRLSPRGVEDLIRRTAETDGKAVEIWMEQEPGSSGVNTIDHYRRRVLPEFTFRGYKTTGSKEERANPVSAQAEAGNIRLIEAPWNKELIDELIVFPDPNFHDDQVDALSGAFAQLASRGKGTHYSTGYVYRR